MAAPAGEGVQTEAKNPPRVSMEDIGFDDEDYGEDKSPWIFTPGRLAAYKAALLIFIIEEGLPMEQKWVYYTLMLHHRQNFENRIYAYSYILIFLLWYRPTIPLFFVYASTNAVSFFMRVNSIAEMKDYQKDVHSMLDFTLLAWILRSFVDISDLTPTLEYVLGPADFWIRAILPILPGLLSAAERHSINGFVPEGKQGIKVAVMVWACTAVLPRLAQSTLWTYFSAPDPQDTVMFVDWAISTLVWTWLGVPLQVAYGLHLFINQFPHPEFQFRHRGGGPSIILERERRGCLWFVATSFLLKSWEISYHSFVADGGSLDLPLRIWFPFLLALGFAAYFLKYGVAVRMTKFKHRPVKGKDGIRLLRLRAQPYFKDSPVQCDMIHVTLRKPPSYMAISHRWGPPEEEQQIILIDDAPFLVSPNVYSLLLAKRDARCNLLLWIDSICINQTDKKEKSRQVALMRSIFEEASSTIGWLGDDPGAKSAFDLIERINGTPKTSTFAALQQEQDDDWKQLQKLLSNAWFERIWVIQEIAVATNPSIRYGNQEMEWKAFAKALHRVVRFSFASLKAGGFIESQHLLNVLVMENLRIQVEDVDYLKFKDALKLGLRFNATLSVDKVYALLGIVDERYNPLFHPTFSRTDSLDSRVAQRAGLFKDMINTLETLNDLLGTGSGSSNTRRGRSMRSSPARGIRHLRSRVEDLSQITRKLKGLKDESESNSELLGPDYSERVTPELVYTRVAKDLVRQGDTISFIRHAGIGLGRNHELENLPSWVPDWSTDVNVYMLPQRNSPWHAESKPGDTTEEHKHAEKKDSVKKEETVIKEENGLVKEEENHAKEDWVTVSNDDGIGILRVKGIIVGKLTHLSTLSESITASSGDVFEDAKHDFDRQLSNHSEALILAHQHCQHVYGSEEATEEAFCRTALADTMADGVSPASNDVVADWKSWITGWRGGCEISALLRLEEAHKNRQKANGVDPEALRHGQERISQNYLFLRHMQCSSNAKFAHLVKTDILPSFNRYRWRGRDAEPAATEGDNVTRESPLSIFGSKAGLISAYTEYVDYTLGRKLGITDSGRMGLVPAAGKVGDIVVFVEREKLWLLLRRMDCQDLRNGAGKNQEDQRKTFERGTALIETASQPDETYRLVGESYIHEPNAITAGNSRTNQSNDEMKENDERWFKLW